MRSAADENMGRIVDVLVDRAGQVRAAIIDFGGFLGVGSRKIAVDWNALHFPEPGKAGERIALELTRDQVKTAPEYQDGKPVVVLGALGKLEPLPEYQSVLEMSSARGTITPLWRQSGPARREPRRGCAAAPTAGR